MKSHRSVPILTYHHVHPDGHPALNHAARVGSRGRMAGSVFRSHLELLIGSGWQIRSTSEIINWLIDGSDLPQKTATIHFDNGWFDTWETAKTVLDEFGLRALVYIISGLTENASISAKSGSDGWMLRTRTEGHVSSADHAVMRWEHVENLLNNGWEVGAHTVSHPKMTRLLVEQGPDGVRRQIEDSNQMLCDRQGLNRSISPIRAAIGTKKSNKSSHHTIGLSGCGGWDRPGILQTRTRHHRGLNVRTLIPEYRPTKSVHSLRQQRGVKPKRSFTAVSPNLRPSGHHVRIKLWDGDDGYT